MERENGDNDEIKDEIEAALNDQRGVISHQKRLAFCLSLGIVELLENYIKRNSALKPGIKINHQWFKKNRENVKKILASKITVSLEKLNKLDKILEVAYNIESKRNELAYGKAASEDFLTNLIDQYLEIKKEIEKDGN